MIALIVGLGNIGKEYERTRHNAGFWFVQALANSQNITLSYDKKFCGDVGRGQINGVDFRLLLPHTLMNRSGLAVAPMMKFYDITTDRLLVAHDELDIATGLIKLKTGGGHGGHNGLRDIIPHTGAEFHRLRIGIGRPNGGSVSNFVLSAPTSDDQTSIDRAIAHALESLPLWLSGNTEKARSYINAHTN